MLGNYMLLQFAHWVTAKIVSRTLQSRSVSIITVYVSCS